MPSKLAAPGDEALQKNCTGKRKLLVLVLVGKGEEKLEATEQGSEALPFLNSKGMTRGFVEWPRGGDLG